MSSSWIPLHVHSQYSILNSTASVYALAERAKQLKIPALALTDQGNLYGVVDFFKACKSVGVKPIIGCELWVAPGCRTDKKRIPGHSPGYPILLLAKNQEGYRNLSRLSSIAFMEGFYYQPRIDKATLEKHTEGLICLSGPPRSSLSSLLAQDREEEAIQEIHWYQEHFQENYYLAIQRQAMKEPQMRLDRMDQESWLWQRALDEAAQQDRVNHALIRLSKEYQIPLVATHEIHYLDREDWRAHEILLNIQSGEPCEIWERDSRGNPKNKILNPKREVFSTHELYFHTSEEMAVLFADLPEALTQTQRIADACKLDLDFKTKHYPVYSPPNWNGEGDRMQAAKEYLYSLSKNGIQTRYTQDKLEAVRAQIPDKDPLQVIQDRFEYEFHLLASTGLCDYFLIVYDLIHWAKQRGIPMGPGRGSAAGSLIAYLIGITDIEPLRFHLFFERFINPERLSYPDIDVDICMDRRQEVIEYAMTKYGKDRVAQIITFGTMKAKMAIRDVGRVLNVPLAKVTEIVKLIPDDLNITLEKALQDPTLKNWIETDEEARRLLEMAKRCEGSIRNTSTHAGGLIISAAPIAEVVPICTAKDSEMAVTQFSMKPVAEVGMLKIDLLGLKTLTALQLCSDAIARSQQQKVEWNNLLLNDKKTFELITQGLALGVFQLESPGMRDLCKQLRLDRFEEIIAVLSLYRPGPMEMIPSFINRKHGREKIEMDHPLMSSILAETYGVIVYQEQVMQIASKLAGYSLGEGDMLRRAMGKKDREEMVEQRKKFVMGAVEKGIDLQLAGAIFDKIEPFAAYGFNKSHAAAYAYLSYATAYFKANYPSEWLASLMSCDRHDLTRVATFICEARTMGIAVLPPDINEANLSFTASKSGIRFALSGIKGIGAGIAEHILKERKRGGPYRDLYDFLQRAHLVGKKQAELLIEAGCFDFTSSRRDAMLASVEMMHKEAARARKDEIDGVISLFAFTEPVAPPPLTESSIPFSLLHLLQREKELLGFYVTGHPLDNYQEAIKTLEAVPLKALEELPLGSLVAVAFTVSSVQIKLSTKTQKKFAVLVAADATHQIEFMIWSDLFATHSELLKENQLLYAMVQIEEGNSQRSFVVRGLGDLHYVTPQEVALQREASKRFQKSSRSSKFQKNPEKKENLEKTVMTHLNIYTNAEKINLSHVVSLKQLFRTFPGETKVSIHFKKENDLVASLHIGSEWGISHNPSFEERLNALSTAIFMDWELTKSS